MPGDQSDGVADYLDNLCNRNSSVLTRIVFSLWIDLRDEGVLGLSFVGGGWLAYSNANECTCVGAFVRTSCTSHA